MNWRIIAIIALYVVGGLTIAKYRNAYVPPMTPEQTQAEYVRLSSAIENFVLPIQTLYQRSGQATTGDPANSQNSADFRDKTAGLLSRINALNPDHLTYCQQSNFFEHIGHLQSQLWHLDRSPDPSAVRDIETYVYQLTGTAYSIDDIEDIAESEIRGIEKSLSALEKDIVKSGAAKTLEEFAGLPEFYRTHAAIIQSEYTDLLKTSAGPLSTEFFDYSVPQASAFVVRQAHRWNAVASYSGNQMVLYFTEDAYDTKLYRMLVVHEITPGHHLRKHASQSRTICGNQRMRGLSLLEEGWATYAEYIAESAGFFDPPDQRLGWLDYRYIRAMRILLDIHATRDNWNTAQLKALWEDRLPARLHPLFEREQGRLNRARHHHFGYIFGRRSIESARAELSSEMGRDFDIKIFHDAILRARYQHMSTFTDQVRALMNARRAPNAGPSVTATTG